MNKGQTVKGGLDVNIPNALSILRILLTPLFAALYLRGQTGAAVAVLLLCALTDVLDGYIARRFDNTGINIEDLISIGTIGLIKAINTYRSDKNIKLATYASRCIENEILMYLRKNANQKAEVSFDEPLNTDWDGNELLLSDILGTDGDTVLRPIEDDVDRQLLTTAVSRLSEREREIITLRFGLGGREEKTQKEVADYLGISQSYISRLEKRIIARLKREILKMS